MIDKGLREVTVVRRERVDVGPELGIFQARHALTMTGDGTTPRLLQTRFLPGRPIVTPVEVGSIGSNDSLRFYPLILIIRLHTDKLEVRFSAGA